MSGLLLALALPLDLSWTAPDGCPDADRVRELVSAQTHEPVDPLSVAGTVTHDDAGWHLQLRFDGVDVREIEGESCDAVTDAAAVMIAMRFQGQMVPTPDADTEPEPEPEPEEPARPDVASEPEPPDAIEPEPEPAPQPPPPTRPRPSGWLSLGGGVALGILPGVGGAIALDGGIEGRLWRFGVGMRGYPVRTTVHPSDTAITGRFDLVSGTVLGCGVPAVRIVHVPLCARIEAGGLRGVGDGDVADPRPRWSAWAGAAVSAGLSIRVLSWLAPFVAAEGSAGFVTPGFTVGGTPGDLYTARIPGFRAFAGLEVHVQSASRKHAAG